jgi:BirA family biotin operon repressor/biotin-[acetyl-CoA-carboxylase] ligase
MVNQETLALLQRLKSSDTPVSGTALAQSLGVSRVALWKRFEALRAAGYRVEADRRGYRLVPSDKPLPWEFPGDEARTFHFETLASTMDEALRLGLAGHPDAAVIAETQSAGRGRADRTWTSTGGDLLVTLVLRPRLPMAYTGALGLEALAALADTLEELYALDLTLKWPNDLMAADRKVAGMLVEAWGPADRPQFYTLGLGLNVHGLPKVGRPAASVDALGRAADRRAILALWRAKLGRWAAAPELVPGRWAQRSSSPAPMTVQTFDGQRWQGVPVGYDRTGSLLLDTGEDTIPIRYGETLRTPGVPL